MSTATKPALPTHLDLPDTDGLPKESALQPFQMDLLTVVLRPIIQSLHPGGRYVIGQDSGIYFRVIDPPLDGCKAPDWFYVGDVSPMFDGEYRRSYVLWHERTPPTLVIDLPCGDDLEAYDQTPDSGKFWVYERAIRAPYYAIFNVDTEVLEVFELVGNAYRLVTANERGRYPIPPLGVELGVWRGTYANYTVAWLRAYRPDGTLLPTPEETEERERRAKAAAVADKERLAAKLRELGVDSDSI